MSYGRYKMYAKQIEAPKNTNDADMMDEYFDDIQTSKWAIKSDDAHLKQAAMYSNQEENLDHLRHAAETH